MMRSLTFVPALAALCAAPPAWAQVRILTTHDQAPAQTSSAPALEAGAPQARHPMVRTEQQQSSPPAQAQQPAPPPTKTEARILMTAPPLPSPPSRRFSFERVDEGFLRFDHATGKVAYCGAQPAGWSCQAVPEHRAALEQEIEHLQDEVATLKKQIAGLRASPPPRPPAPVPPPAAAPRKGGHPNESGRLKLPSERDVARARAYIAQTWHRLVDMINDIQRGMFGRDDHDAGLSRT